MPRIDHTYLNSTLKWGFLLSILHLEQTLLDCIYLTKRLASTKFFCTPLPLKLPVKSSFNSSEFRACLELPILFASSFHAKSKVRNV